MNLLIGVMSLALVIVVIDWKKADVLSWITVFVMSLGIWYLGLMPLWEASK